MTLNFDTNTIALNGYCCYSTNPLGIHSKTKNGINDLDLEIAQKTLLDNKEKGLFNIFSVHCGQEHVNYPNYDHVLMARQLSEVAPYVFYGHHPHVAQGLETINDSLIPYSLGNFCFDDVYTSKSKEPLIKQTENNRESFILELEIENNTLINHTVISIYMGDKEMQIDNSAISDKIVEYSKLLKTKREDYKQKRKYLIDEYISTRKKKRDLNWYVKRLNYKSFFLILSSKLNSNRYKKNIIRHLK